MKTSSCLHIHLRSTLLLAIFFSSPVIQAQAIEPPETVQVPSGSFIMGSTRAERETAYLLDEAAYNHTRTREWKWYEDEPRSKPNLNSYRITKTLVTNRQYAAFIADTQHPAPGVDAATWRGYKLIHPFKRTLKFSWKAARPSMDRLDHPVVLVHYSDALAYAKWVSQKTGRTWRLPTEAQWEKAARGTDGRLYPWGNTFNATRLNSHDQGPFDTVAVGKYPTGASPYGLLDAAGQVFEWTQTSAGKSRHIVKGGSWDDKGCGVCRAAARHSRPDHLKHILVGFRLVTDSD